MSGQVLSCEFIASQDVEVVTVDFDVTTNWEVSWVDELHAVVDILVFVSLKEGTLLNSGVLLSWFVDRDGIISKIEGNDESPVDVFWNSGVEPSGISENLVVIINILEEIDLGLLWN